MNLKSIRWQLPLSYIGIALLAAIASGVLMLATLRGYYQRQERLYLEINSQQISLAAAQLLQAGLPDDFIADQATSWSFLLQARVQIFDPQGELIADSGAPDAMRVLTVSNVPGGSFTGMGAVGVGIDAENLVITTEGTGSPVLPQAPAGSMIVTNICVPGSDGSLDEGCLSQGVQVIYRTSGAAGASLTFTAPITPSTQAQADVVGVALPSNSSVYGYNLSPDELESASRSNQSVEQPIQDDAGNALGTLILSESLAYGSEIVTSVVRVWAGASLAALVIAGAAGWLASRRITTPVLHLTDVTARMSAGDLSARSGADSDDEFGMLGRSFDQMAEQIENLIGTLRRFVVDAAHELNTPITALQTDIELARATVDGGERERLLERIKGQITRLHVLVRSLLDLSRLESRTSTPIRQPVDLAELAQSLAEVYASRAEQAEISFKLELPGDALILSGDPVQLRVAVENLLDNALKFTPPSGKVCLRLETEGDQVILSIADTGIGIPADDLPSLFQRFHRGRNASAYPGNGLGLAIVDQIVRLHGGSVSAENTSPGVRFTLRLPALLPTIDKEQAKL